MSSYQRGGNRGRDGGDRGRGRDFGSNNSGRGGGDRGRGRGFERDAHREGDRGGRFGQDRGGYRDGDRGRGRGGGPGQRGGSRGSRGGRQHSPVRLDVTTLAQSINCQKVAQKKPRGQIGVPVKLVTNHYPMKFEDIKCFHYDIAISLRRTNGKLMEVSGQGVRKLRKERQMDNIKIIEKMADEWAEMSNLEGPIPYVFDGNKNLYTRSKLNIGRDPITRIVVITLDGFSEQTYEVRVKFVKDVSMNIINLYLSGATINVDLAEFREALQVLDIVMRYCPQKIRVPVGRNLYSREEVDRQSIGQNAMIVFGHHQSLQLTQSGLTLNVDRTTTPFRSDGPLLDFIARELNREDMKRVVFDQNVVRRLNQTLKDLKIFTEHIVMGGRPQKRKHIIDRMINEKANERRMTKDGVEMSIQQYFEQSYGKQVQYLNIPLIQIKGGTPDNRKYLPVELCQVYPDQAMPRRLISQDIQRQIVESTNSQVPKKRFEKIHNSLNEIENESRELMANFGLTISKAPIKLDGRQLPAPKVLGDRNRLHQPIALNSYLFLNLSAAVKPQLRANFENFFNSPEGLIATGKRMGMNIRRIDTSGAQPPREVGTANDNDLKSNETLMKAFESKMKVAKSVFPNLQLIFVVIPKSPELYEYIKLLADIVYGIPQQCILDKNFMEPKRGYFDNFLRKTNAKLNGCNQIVVERPRFSNPSNVDTMVVGVDVTHPGYHNPLANERVISSIAAVVGSYDKDFTKYVASVSAQPMNVEIIIDFDQLIRNLLKGFFGKNKCYPKHIVVFRDGVSDSQFQAVIDQEIPLIKKAYRDERVQFQPLITEFVVQKKHNTRFMPLEVQKDFKGKDILNIKAGTVVDHTITNPLNDEFHLCSHNGLLGTSRHAKYIVLQDDHKLSVDDKQKLAYHMCYAYCRCATPISNPAPVRYADLAAYRTKQHTAAKNIEYQLTQPEGETDAQKRLREAENIRLMNSEIRVHQNIVFLPYYC